MHQLVIISLTIWTTTLNENQKLKHRYLLKHCLPKLSIESIGIEDDMPKEFEIVVNNDGEVVETIKNTTAFKRDKSE